jgi:histidinol-phosphate phosphatase family protein
MDCDLLLPPFRYDAELQDYLQLPDFPNQLWDGKIAFLDRDGVINLGSEFYINSPDEVILLPNAGLCIGQLRRHGYRICVVTNQSPIGRGLWTHKNLHLIHSKISELLLQEDKDALLDLILYSPYSPEENSWARKPNPGMLEAGRQILGNSKGKKINILYGEKWINSRDESDSIMVGDRDTDQLAAENYGVKFFRCNPDIGLYDVIDSILGENNG